MALKSAGMKNWLQACSIIRMQHFKRATGFQLQQHYSSHHWATDDDEFAELGSPLVSGLRRPVKLMTEKNDRIKKNDSCWNSSGSFSAVEAIAGTECVQLDSKGIFSDSLDDVVDETNAINSRTAFVTVANIPPSIKLPKREEATQKALSPGVVTINNVHLPIHRGRGTVTVRIMNICSKTSDYVVHEICRSRGFLIKVERIYENTLDVFFGVENNSDAKNILKGLNYAIKDDCNWLASLQSGDTAASSSSSDDEDNDEMSCNSGLKIGERIAELKQLYTMKKVHVEDLENLHEVIRYIKSRNTDLKGQI